MLRRRERNVAMREAMERAIMEPTTRTWVAG
jgi:hypothetical protein